LWPAAYLFTLLSRVTEPSQVTPSCL